MRVLFVHQNQSVLQAFASPTYPPLATLGTNVDWDHRYLLQACLIDLLIHKHLGTAKVSHFSSCSAGNVVWNVNRCKQIIDSHLTKCHAQAQGSYRPRFKLEPRVIRVPIVPGSDPRTAYGDLAGRGVKGIVLETFGTGMMMTTLARMSGLWTRLVSEIGSLEPLNPERFVPSACHLKASKLFSHMIWRHSYGGNQQVACICLQATCQTKALMVGCLGCAFRDPRACR